MQLQFQENFIQMSCRENSSCDSTASLEVEPVARALNFSNYQRLPAASQRKVGLSFGQYSRIEIIVGDFFMQSKLKK